MATLSSHWLHRLLPVAVQQEAVTLHALAVPVILTYLMGFFNAIVAQITVGHLSSEALAAAALANMFANAFGTSIILGSSQAVDTLASQAFGAGNFPRVGLITQRGVAVSLAICFPVALAWWNAGAVLQALGQNASVVSLSSGYLKILLGGLPACVVFEVMKKMMLSIGMARPPMVINGVGVLVSAVLHYILVWNTSLGFFGSPVATVLSQWLMMLCMCLYIGWHRSVHSLLTSMGLMAPVPSLCTHRGQEDSSPQPDSIRRTSVGKQTESNPCPPMRLSHTGPPIAATVHLSCPSSPSLRPVPSVGLLMAIHSEGAAARGRTVYAPWDSREEGGLGGHHGVAGRSESDGKSLLSLAHTSSSFASLLSSLRYPSLSIVVHGEGGGGDHTLADSAESTRSAARASSTSRSVHSSGSVSLDAMHATGTAATISVGPASYDPSNPDPDALLDACWTGIDVAGALRSWPEYLALGLPSAAMLFTEWASYEATSLIAGYISVSALAVHTILATTASLSFMPALGYGVAGSIRVGQKMGERSAEGGRLVYKTIMYLGAGYVILNGALILGLGKVWGRVFTDDPAIVAGVGDWIWLLSVYTIFDGAQCLTSGVLRGLGRPTIAAVANVLSYVGVGLTCAWAFGVSLGWGVAGIWIAYILAVVVAYLLMRFQIYRLDFDKIADESHARAQAGGTPLASGGH